MLKRDKGNIIDMAEAGQFQVIVHGCNCQNVMGSGLAKELRERYPTVFAADVKATEQWKIPITKLGNFSYAYTGTVSNPFIVINAYTQLHYLPRNVDHFEYESFKLILRKLIPLAKTPDTNFGFPYIGMGLAGGRSDRIIPMIQKFANEVDFLDNGSSVTLVEFDQ